MDEPIKNTAELEARRKDNERANSEAMDLAHNAMEREAMAGVSRATEIEEDVKNSISNKFQTQVLQNDVADVGNDTEEDDA